MDPIRVLIVDDSKIFCQMLKDDLEKGLPAGSEILTARDAIAAWAQLLSDRPQVILLDEEMPRLGGTSFLEWLKDGDIAIPTMLMSGNPAYKEKALAAGAALFLLKPSGSFVGESPDFFRLVRESVTKLARRPSRLPDAFGNDTAPQLPTEEEPMTVSLSSPYLDDVISLLDPKTAPSLIAIGASTGGPEALAMLLAKLQPPLPPILVVQHLFASLSRRLADRLDVDSELSVREAADGETLLPDHVYIAPTGKHLRVRKLGRDLLASCMSDPLTNTLCPSADVLFDSVAATVGAASLGIILTGTGTDGARGLLRMRQAGARTIGQDEISSAVYDMPHAAWEMGSVDTQVSLQDMAEFITAAAQRN